MSTTGEETIVTPVPQASGTILFLDDDKIIKHVLEDVVRVYPNQKQEALNWMKHNNIKSIPDLYQRWIGDQKFYEKRDYKVGKTNKTLTEGTSNVFRLLCWIARDFVADNRRTMKNSDWEQFLAEYYEEFIVR